MAVGSGVQVHKSGALHGVIGGSAGGVGFEAWLATTRSGVDVRDEAVLRGGHGREEQRRDGCEEEEGRGLCTSEESSDKLCTVLT